METTYKIVDANDNSLDTVIEKNYLKTATFTLRDVVAHMEKLTKEKTELKAKIGVEKASIENILHFNPTLAELTPEQLHAAYLLGRAKAFLEGAEPRVEEITKALDTYVTEKETILTTLNIKI